MQRILLMQQYQSGRPSAEPRLVDLPTPIHAIVDDEDYEYLRHRQWFVVRNGGGVGKPGDGRTYSYALAVDAFRIVSMHRLVLERKLGRPIGRRLVADHINHDRYDNRRSNLREATYSENAKNRKGTSEETFCSITAVVPSACQQQKSRHFPRISAVLKQWAPIGAMTALACAAIFAPVRFSISDSAAPAGIYRIVAQRQIRRGELALVCLPPKIAAFGFQRKYIGRGFCPGGFEPVGKVIAGLPGDRIEPAKALERDGKGRALTHIAGPVTMPAGEVWLYGEQPYSWDSRYYGAVPMANVKQRLEPLWTWR